MGSKTSLSGVAGPPGQTCQWPKASESFGKIFFHLFFYLSLASPSPSPPPCACQHISWQARRAISIFYKVSILRVRGAGKGEHVMAWGGHQFFFSRFPRQKASRPLKLWGHQVRTANDISMRTKVTCGGRVESWGLCESFRWRAKRRRWSTCQIHIGKS